MSFRFFNSFIQQSTTIKFPCENEYRSFKYVEMNSDLHLFKTFHILCKTLRQWKCLCGIVSTGKINKLPYRQSNISNISNILIIVNIRRICRISELLYCQRHHCVNCNVFDVLTWEGVLFLFRIRVSRHILFERNASVVHEFLFECVSR